MAIDFSKSISTYGTSYKRATMFFPQEIKESVFILYAFVREADNIVDTADETDANKQQRLHRMYHETKHLYDTGCNSQQSLIAAYVTVCKTYGIPRERTDHFFNAMNADLSKKRYTTYHELQEYMYGSAEVIGLMMGKIIGMNEQGVVYAKKLGEAMQYTNFLRDIKEDYHEYWRIYLPQERLAVFGLSHNDSIAYCTWTPISTKRKEFLKGEITFIRTLYTESKEGIRYLNPQGRLPVYLSAALYEAILDRIEAYDYDVFTHDMHTTRLKKARIVLEKSTCRIRKKRQHPAFTF